MSAPTTNFKLHESNIKSEKKSLELPSAKNIETKAESQKEAVLAGQDNINPPVTTTTAASQDDLENEKHAPEEEKTKEIKQSPQKRRKVAGPAMPPPSSPQQSSGHSQVKASNDGADADETWVPPSGQTGDGRTSLNEKYGY
ncbi:hypothetical protein H4219_000609 [Mycoemilia scoparia]|uniref:Uncharacterized protein n=1 Tax=Mycoemilia scoparia TaxID=417184 RepID=A0A9W8A2R7_9FUNG|nr:hypothetical protein H4219_000609 [Mycoemilia scoparia]